MNIEGKAKTVRFKCGEIFCWRQAQGQKGFPQRLRRSQPSLVPSFLVGADLLLFGRGPDRPATPTDRHRPVDPKEELQDGLVGNASNDDHRDGDHLEHIGAFWPKCSIGGVADPHGGATHVRRNVQQEDSTRHHQSADVLWFQLAKLKVRLAEVPQGNLDATADSTDHEAQHGSVGPVDVPPEQRQVQVERTRHVGFESPLEVVRPRGDVQVQETRA